MAQGDHIRVRRSGYWHHGIDCGDGTVIHYSGEKKNRRNASVTVTSMADFARGRPVELVLHHDADPPEVVMQRAKSRLREARYMLLFNNCEHFAYWCKTGRHKSKQAKRFLVAAGSTALLGFTVALGAGLKAGLRNLRGFAR
jgi:hypothetical protein